MSAEKLYQEVAKKIREKHGKKKYTVVIISSLPVGEDHFMKLIRLRDKPEITTARVYAFWHEDKRPAVLESMQDKREAERKQWPLEEP